jgi:hypothetical protein
LPPARAISRSASACRAIVMREGSLSTLTGPPPPNAAARSTGSEPLDSSLIVRTGSSDCTSASSGVNPGSRGGGRGGGYPYAPTPPPPAPNAPRPSSSGLSKTESPLNRTALLACERKPGHGIAT